MADIMYMPFIPSHILKKTLNIVVKKRITTRCRMIEIAPSELEDTNVT
jgi:hypothetical protein